MPSKVAWGKDGDFCFRAKAHAGSLVPEAANIQPLALPCWQEVQPRLLWGWQTDPHIPIHSSPQKVCPMLLQDDTLVPLAWAVWLGKWESRGFPQETSKCRCGMCSKSKSVSPRLNRQGKPIFPRAFEVYRL